VTLDNAMDVVFSWLHNPYAVGFPMIIYERGRGVETESS
jgi:hypothetical protein